MTMNQAPSRVRAVARVGADPTGAAEPATFVRRRRPGYLGPVNVIQLVLLEALVVLILVLLRHSPYLLIIGIVLTLAVIVITFARSGGRWWVERALIRWHYNRRGTSGRLPADDIRLAALHRLVPDLTVQTIDAMGNIRVGVGLDGAGWFAAIAVVPPAGVNGDALGRLPLNKLAAIARDAEQPGAVMQVVRHAVPAPGPGVFADQNESVAGSYRELVRQFGGPMPADQLTWVAVRLDARSVAESLTDPADDSGEIPAMLGALVRRVGKALRRAGLEYQVLDGDGLLDALTRSCDLEQPQGQRARGATESWTHWRSGSLAHACFWLSSWPGLRGSGTLLDELSTAPAALTSVALIMAPYDDLTETQCLIRIATEPTMLDQSCAQLQQIAARAGARLFRLDGEQAPAVYATAPTGGGAR